MGQLNKLTQFLVIVGLCLTVFGTPSTARADECPTGLPEICTCSELGSQKIAVCIPPVNFNGRLVVYAHGYIYTQVGEPFLPAEEMGDLPDLFLSLGFAVATTSYSKNGYAVEQAGEDLNALVTHLLDEKTGLPTVDKVLLIGASEGALIITMLLENPQYINHNVPYDGGLALCGPVGGMRDQINYLGDFRVAFDYFFPWVFDFGMADVSVDACDDWDDYVLDIEDSIQSHPWKKWRLFDITGAAFDWFDPGSFANTAVDVLRYSICGSNDLKNTVIVYGECTEQNTTPIPFDNHDTWYDTSWWFNRKVERVEGDQCAFEYVNQYYNTTGDLTVPLVTLHNISDPIVPFWHERLYKKKVELIGNDEFLTVLPPVLSYGHCNFAPWQVLGAFYILLNQVNN
jgi:pimeloyl-ACP methyl ester carboxylesterase